MLLLALLLPAADAPSFINEVVPLLTRYGCNQGACHGKGAGQNGFIVIPPQKAGADLFKPIVGRGSAFADIDGDGDLDVFIHFNPLR